LVPPIFLPKSTGSNADGDALEPVDLGKNIGGTKITGGSSSRAIVCEGAALFSCAFFIFIASFEGGLVVVGLDPTMVGAV
jgi:hypothetical protein